MAETKFLDKDGLTYYHSKVVGLIPTKVSELTNDSGFTTNTGTITEIQKNGTSVAKSGVANISVPTKTSELTNDSGYKTTDTNTTYSLTQDSTDGHKITLTPSSGTAQTITIPDNNTTYTAGTNVSISSANVINGKSNSSIVDLIYPVGSLYMSVTSTSPATLFGGTWEQIKDSFILSAGDTYSAGATGGSASTKYTPSGSVGSHTLTTSEIPKHTHTYSKSATTTGASTGNTGSTTLTAAQSGLPSHTHKVTDGDGPGRYPGWGSLSGWGVQSLYCSSNSAIANTGSTGGTSATSGHTHSLNSHTHSITLTSTNSGETGTGGGHTHGFTGTEASISTLPPYLAVYVWKRTK